MALLPDGQGGLEITRHCTAVSNAFHLVAAGGGALTTRHDVATYIHHPGKELRAYVAAWEEEASENDGFSRLWKRA
jgi:hypothetical protein